MPKLSIEGHGDGKRTTYDVDEGTRLVNAIADCGVDISHRCGGNAACTTCRVEFQHGEPARITRAEREKLQQAGLAGQARLACQCLVEGDMALTVLMPVSQESWSDPGPRPDDQITPEPQWISIPEA